MLAREEKGITGGRRSPDEEAVPMKSEKKKGGKSGARTIATYLGGGKERGKVGGAKAGMASTRRGSAY